MKKHVDDVEILLSLKPFGNPSTVEISLFSQRLIYWDAQLLNCRDFINTHFGTPDLKYLSFHLR